MPETIRIDIAERVARVTLDRPKIRNAFNGTMLGELREGFRALAADPDVRVVVLTGAGAAFCAGADLNWMRSVLSGTFEDNLAEATGLAETLRAMDELPQPIVGRINGPAMGGGVGFVSVTDIAIASTDAFFALSEVRVGLVPATISPFVMRRIGYPMASEMFLTGRKVTAGDAVAAGLVNRLVPPGELDGAVETIVNQLLANGPEALAASKELLRQVPRLNPHDARGWTANVIARRRQSAEGQEGMAAFLEKRPPAWR